MKHIKSPSKRNPLDDYAKVGTKDCQGFCDREVIRDKDGVLVICNGCMRIVMDNRDNIKK